MSKTTLTKALADKRRHYDSQAYTAGLSILDIIDELVDLHLPNDNACATTDCTTTPMGENVFCNLCRAAL